jgi:PAS domain S-box-containing protein
MLNTYFELPIIVQGGATRWIGQNVQLIMDNQKPVGFQAVARDVTERRRTEEELRRSHISLAEAQRIAYMGNWEWDTQTGEMLWSDEMFRICGLTRETFDGSYEAFLDLIHPEDRKTIKDAIHKTLTERTKTEIKYRLIRRDGSVREVLQRVELLSEGTGKSNRLMSTIQDMTLQNQAERELQKAKDLLMQSEKLVSIGRLSAGVAHEILNPVNIISVELQLLFKMEALSPEAKGELTVCMEQVKRIVAIAEGLKQFSRIPIQKTMKNDMKRVIDHILSLSSSQLKIEAIETEVYHQPDLPEVPMDREKIKQVILNLITNAIDAMEGKEKKVLRISTSWETAIEGEDCVRVIIADSGTGIQEKDVPVLFDPFFTTKEPGKGTGLGLFISYGIIHDHGGRIWAENNEWGGASFFIELPTATDANRNSS